MVHLRTRRGESVLCLVFLLATCFRGGECACQIDCELSGGTPAGTNFCTYEVKEELPADTEIASLVFSAEACNNPSLNPTSPYLEINGTSIYMKDVLDYDEDPGNLPSPFVTEVRCPSGTCIGRSLVIEFENIDDNPIEAVNSGSTAEVKELIIYNSDEPIEVTPAISAIDKDVASFLSYTILDDQADFELLKSVTPNREKACFSTYGTDNAINTETPILVVKDSSKSFNFQEASSIHLTVMIQSFMMDNGCTEGAVDNINYTLTINVQDLDDQPPAFNDTLYDCIVEEESRTFIKPPNIYAYDLDEGINTAISYSLLPQDDEWDCTTYLEINESSGIVSILEAFDFEQYEECKLTLLAQQIDRPARSARAPLTVSIINVNDMCPEIEVSSNRGFYIEGDSFVSDDTTQDWLLLSLKDADPILDYTEIEIDSIYFDLKNISCDGQCYRISPNETKLESIEAENITVTVRDTLYNSSSCQFMEIIEILIPEQTEVLNPTFEETEYTAMIDENETGFLVQVTALNGDDTKDGIEYSLPDPEDVFFSINQTGHIHVEFGLDFETSPQYFVTVKATDGRWTDVERYSTVVVNVTVIDVNDNIPVLEGFPLYLYVSESTPSGTVISTVKATDRDAGSSLTYNFQDTPAVFPFILNNETGEISTSDDLDADVENGREYQATVTASDGKTTTAPEDMIITVVDVNDNPPVMSSESQFLLNISENDPGPLIFQVIVTDKDASEVNRNYSLTSDGSSNVTIDQDTGQISVTGPFDREINSEFQFTLTAINTASPFWETSENVVVSILDVNDNFPTFTEETERYCNKFTVTEGSKLSLCKFAATDDDETDSENSRITYSVDEEEYFNIDSSTGELSLIAPLDRETASNISVTVVASDNGETPNSNSMTVPILIDGVNDNRPFFMADENYANTVHEETTPNTMILSITANDIDVPTQDPIYYKPVDESDQVWETFYLKSENGLCEIYLKSTLNLEDSPYELEISTYDGDSNPSYAAGPDNSTVVVIEVEPRVACDITIDPEYMATLKESDLSDNGTVVDVNASSSCSSSEDGLMYSIEDQVLQPVAGAESESTFFSIDKQSGEIFAMTTTEVEIGMYVLTINVKNETGSDLDQSEVSAQVYINVTDVNNKCPYFEETEYSARYTEGDGYLSNFNSPQWLVVTAIDDDTEFIGNVTFSDEATFTEDTTEVSSKRSFIVAVNGDLSTNTTLNVSVTDETSVTICEDSITTIYITVREYLSPVFLNAPYSTSLPENSDVEVLVIQVIAQNDDGTDDGITYEIVSPLNTPFMINDVSGEIFVAFEGVDYEEVNFYNLTVSATDNRWNEKRSSSTQVFVTIEDVNEFEPEFIGLPTTISVQESVQTGSEIFFLKANDRDTDDNEILIYQLISGGDGKFAVDSTSGSVYTNQSIDFEVDPREYTLTVSVSDEVFESVSELTIQILDVNDNAPTFNQQSYNENFTENQSPLYLDVMATDADEMSTVSCRLSGDYPNGATVNDTGFIIFSEIFDREQQEHYSFFVIVSDGQFKTSAEIEISVMDENDEYPEITSFCDGGVDLKEDLEETALVCNISAVDADAPGTYNSIITYKLLDSDGGPFEIDTSTGEIFLRGKLDFETEAKSYMLLLQAGDGLDGSENTVNKTLQVFVLDVNDNSPTFDSHPSTITLVFDLAVGSEVTKLLVSDADEAPFNTFLCEKSDGSDASWDTFYLTTMRDGCSIMLGAALNTSIGYTLNVTVVDPVVAGLTDYAVFDVVVSSTYPCEITLEVENVTQNKTEVTSGDVVADVQGTSNCSDSEEGILFTIFSQRFTSALGYTNELSEEFDIFEENGTVFYSGSTEFPSVGEHLLVVEAVNETDNVVRAKTQFVITIEDVDVSEPEFPDPPQIPDNPDPSSAPIFVGRFDEGDEYVYSYNDTARLIITANDDDTCFSGKVEILEPSATPFYLDVQSNGSCEESFRAYLRVNRTWQEIQNITTFQVVLLDGEDTEIGMGNVTVARLPLSPVFQESPMPTVEENANVGDNVTMVMALNNDGTTDGILYEVVSQTNFFEIRDANSGIITVKSVGIDYESNEFFNIIVSAVDTRWDPARTEDIVVRVNVIDVDEFPPVLLPFPRISLQENVALAGTTIYRIQAFDNDASSVLEYNIVNNTEIFNVISDSGDVKLVSSIDAETDPLTYYVHVSVTDGKNVTSDVLFVEITDFNEFPPNITGESEVQMYENDTSATLQVTAIDPDISRLPIQYSIDPSDSIASIDNDGLITFQGGLNYDVQSSYTFDVIAEEGGDEGSFSSIFEVSLVVLDINDHDPELLKDCAQDIEILEGLDTVGTVICTLSATDQDDETKTTFTYFLLNSYGNTFELDAMSGELTVAEELDRETQEDYTLEVLVNDGGSPSRNSSVTEIRVKVGDENDNPPEFVSPPSIPFDVRVNTEAGTTVAELSITDADAFPFNISRCERTDPMDTAWENFTISNDRVGYCEIITLAVLTEPSSYKLDITAVDLNREDLFTTTSVTIEVIEDDACQLNLTLNSSLEFDEGQLGPGSNVTTAKVSSICSGSSDDIAFEITEQTLQEPNGNEVEVGVFTIDVATGVISVNSSANVSIGQYTLVVTAYNTSMPMSSDSDQLVIFVNDINNKCPVFLTDSDEGIFADGDTFIYDVDTPDRLVITAEDPDLEFIGNFTVNSSSILVVETRTSGSSRELELSIVQPIAGNFTVQVMVDDASISCPSDVINIRVYEIPAEELSPVFLNSESFNGTVWENATPGTNITQVKAVDKNGDNTGIKYSFAEEDSYFSIDSTSGVITTGSRGLDYESENIFIKLVFASDGKWDPPRKSEIYVTIEVLDVDEYPLELAEIPSLKVPENTPVNTLVYTAWARDGDGSSNFTFSLDDSTDTFKIDPVSGEIYTNAELDAEVSADYNVTVTVTEGSSSLSDSQWVDIDITDVNDFAPKFDPSEYSAVVKENFKGIQWFMVYATDDDLSQENNYISYTLQDADSRFNIDPQLGNITINTETNPFDREAQESYQFLVVASDSGNPTLSASATISIIIGDENDNAPEFTDSLPQPVDFEEEQAGPIAVFQATDDDNGTNAELTYIVTAVDRASEGIFDITDNGELSAVKPLDREEMESHVLNVYAIDSGNPSLNSSIVVTVAVLDINDNPPAFQPPFDAIVDLSLPIGSEILQVSATDADVSPNDVVIFTPANSSSDVWTTFTLQTNDDGTSIILISQLEVESFVRYTLDVKASNLGGEQVVNQVYTVVVTDGSVCFVTLELPSDGTEKIKQGDLEQNEVFLQLNATSSDGCDTDDFVFVSNSQMYRAFTDSDFVNVTTFSLSPQGELSPTVANVSTGEYQLVVSAVNESNQAQPLSFLETLTILVVEDDNTPPSFNEDYSRNIRLPKESDEFLFLLSADDPDDINSGNGQLLFEKLSESNEDTETNYFRVEDTGRVVAAINLFTNDIVNLTVQVTDSGVPPLSDVTTIQIKLTMDAAPVLETDCGSAVLIEENISPGIEVCNVISTGEEDVSFSLTSGNPEFVIDENGVIQTNDSLDYEETQEYQIIVNAEGVDTKLSSTIQILVKITDVNEYPPYLQDNYYFGLLEDSGNISTFNCSESEFGFISATDADGSEENSFVTYSLEGDSRFEINSTTGVISKVGCIDVDDSSEDQEIALTLYAVNSRAEVMLNDTAVITISITDVNDKPPVLRLNGLQDIETPNFEPEQELFYFNYSDDDLSAKNTESVYSFQPSEEGYLEFNVDEGKISTGTNEPPPGTDIAVLVTITNEAEPMLSDSMTVFYRYSDRTYFPDELLFQSVSLKENNTGIVSTDVLGPVGSTPGVQYSVFDSDGSCSEEFAAEYKSDTYLQLSSKRPLDYEKTANVVFNVTIAFALPSDNCATAKRRRRQTNAVLPPSNSSAVTINLVNVNDEPPSFGAFSLGNGSPNYYQAIHVTRVEGEVVFDLSQDAGKVNDLDEMPTTLSYSGSGEEDLVEVLSDGSVVLKSFLDREADVDKNDNVTVEVTDSEQGSSDSATLKLRVMDDDDLFILWFNGTDPQDLLECVQDCFPANIHVFSEREILMSGSQYSELWLYAVDDGTKESDEDFISRVDFVKNWDLEKYSENCKHLRGNFEMKDFPRPPILIVVFCLAILLLIGTILFILFLLYSYRVYEQERERHRDTQQPPPSIESEDSFRPVAAPLARDESIFDKIAREKNTTLYGSDEAILDLMSEADGLSVDGTLVLEADSFPNGVFTLKEKHEETDGDDDEDVLDPYSTFSFDPAKKDKVPLAESAPVFVPEGTSNGETSMLDDILAEYDNKAFEDDESPPIEDGDIDKEPSNFDGQRNESLPQLSIQHGGGETSTDALINETPDDRDKTSDGSAGRLTSGADVAQAETDASEQLINMDNTNQSGDTNASQSDANNGSQMPGGGVDGHMDSSEKSVPVTVL